MADEDEEIVKMDATANDVPPAFSVSVSWKQPLSDARSDAYQLWQWFTIVSFISRHGTIYRVSTKNIQRKTYNVIVAWHHDLVIYRFVYGLALINGVLQGFPTLFWLPSSTKKPVSYNGGRELDDFVKYIAKEATNELKGYNRKGKEKKEEL